MRMSITKFLELYPYKKWEVKSPSEYSWDHVTFEGNGYVLIGDIRYDFDGIFFREERELWNCIRNEVGIQEA